MIRVTIELLPFGDVSKAKKLSEIHIANDGSGSSDRGNYMARIHPEQKYTPKVVTDYPRNSYHVNRLLYLVLKYFYGKPNDNS